MHHRRFALAALAAAIALVAAACGGDATSDSSSSGDSPTRTIEIDMADIAFEPAELSVSTGETVTFRFTNTGKLAHDAFIGDKRAQSAHEKEMGDDEPGMHHGDDAEDAITVDPGDEGELTYTFDEPGSVEIGCHQPGHYAAGMKIAVTVD